MEASSAPASAPPALSAPVSLRQAATKLGIAHTTLARQIKAGKIPNRGTEDRPLVIVEEAKAARDANLDPQMQRLPLAPAAPVGQAAPVAGPAPAATGLARIKEEQAALDLEKAKRAWEIEQRLWVKVDDVGRGIRTAAVAMRDEFGTLARRLAPDLAGETDPLRIQSRLQAEIETVLERLSTAFEQMQADEQ